MKTSCDYLKKQVEIDTTNVLRNLFEIQVQLEAKMKQNLTYRKEIGKIVQSIDDLFERILE